MIELLPYENRGKYVDIKYPSNKIRTTHRVNNKPTESAKKYFCRTVHITWNLQLK